MDISITDADETPLPPDQVRILNLQVKPYPDGKRVHLHVKLTPFQEKPSSDISIINQDGEIISSTSVIESITPVFDLTLHLRKVQTGSLKVVLVLYYSIKNQQEKREKTIPFKPEKIILDKAVSDFKVNPNDLDF